MFTYLSCVQSFVNIKTDTITKYNFAWFHSKRMLSLYLPLVVRIQCYPILPRSIQQLNKIIKKVHSNAWLVTLFMLFWPAGVFEKMARFSFTRNKQRIIIKKQLWPIKWVGEGFFFGLRGGKSYEKNNWVFTLGE